MSIDREHSNSMLPSSRLRKITSNCQQFWEERMPAVAGIGITLLGFGMAGWMWICERNAFERQARTTVNEISAEIGDRLSLYGVHLDSLIPMLEQPDGQLHPHLQNDDTVQSHLIPYRSLIRTTAEGTVQWVLSPEHAWHPEANLSLFNELGNRLAPTFEETLDFLPAVSQDTSPSLTLVNDGKDLLLHWPLIASPERTPGAIEAVVALDTALEPLLLKHRDLAIEIRDAEQVVYQTHAVLNSPSQPSSVEISRPGGTWSVQAWHLGTVSPFSWGFRGSYGVAGGGLLLGGATVWVLRSRQRYRRQAEQLTSTNRALVFEIRVRERAEEALSRQIHQATLLQQLTHDVRSNLDWESMLQATVLSLGEALNVDRCTIHVGNPEDTLGLERMTEHARPPYKSALSSLVSFGSSGSAYAQRILANDRAVVVHNVFEAKWLTPMTEMCRFLNVKSLMAARTSYQGTPNGVIEVHQCDRLRRWNDEDIQLLEAIAAQVGIAIQQAELYRQQQQFNTKLERQVVERTAALAERTTALQEAFDLEALLQSITERVLYEWDEACILQSVTDLLAERMHLSSCELTVVDPETASHTVRYECAQTLPSILGHTFFADDDLASHTSYLRQGSLLYLCCKHPLAGWISIVQCPIQDEEGIFGILNLIRPQQAEFSQAELRLAQQVATQCAIALRQARLYEAAQQRIEDLQKLSVLKDDFLSTVSHELRSPLANMKMALKMLKILPEPGKQTRYVNMLDQACQQEAQLVDDLLDLQRLEAQCYQLAIEAIDWEQWLPEVVAPFEPRARSRNLHIEVKMPEKTLELHSDRSCLDRIVQELLTNACKYSADGDCIQVTLTETRLQSKTVPAEKREGFRLDITNPANITADEQSQIFEKFYRIPKSDRWRQGGTGLGLALVRQMMEQLQGQISVTSEGGLTTFSLWLPAIPEFKPKWSGELTGTVPVQRDRLALN